MLKKGVLIFLGSLIVNLYTTFVLTILWNWFATVALHTSEISFWMMYGLVLIVGLFQKADDTNEERWKGLLIMVNACVPENRRDDIKEELEGLVPAAWSGVAFAFIGKIIGNSLALGVGFAIHVLA